MDKKEKEKKNYMKLSPIHDEIKDILIQLYTLKLCFRPYNRRKIKIASLSTVVASQPADIRVVVAGARSSYEL